MRLYRFSISCVLWFSLDYFLRVACFRCVGFSFFRYYSREAGWEERLQNDVFCVESDVKL